MASVKAVDGVYPMYGGLQIRPSRSKPQPGSVLLVLRLMVLLNLKAGDTMDVGVATAASGRQLPAVPAVVNVELAFCIFAFVYAAGVIAGIVRRSY